MKIGAPTCAKSTWPHGERFPHEIWPDLRRCELLLFAKPVEVSTSCEARCEWFAVGSKVAPDARSATVNQTVRCIRTRRTAKRNRVSTTLPTGNSAPRISPFSLVDISGLDDHRADPSLIVLQGPQGPEVHCLLNIMKHDRSRLHAEEIRGRGHSCIVML